ncbi:DUF1127 domain-containing protein [Afifella pfennigii]|uniref:DUF1127 domain-containing protein n=1 Tax=Afifella pfennigii TaxID=209897 RepID=UPI00047DA539|nr:DUF1127 domain-containing protein [Afifella pfennigii]
MGAIDTIRGSTSWLRLASRQGSALGAKLHARLALMAQRRRTRRALLELTDTQLKDIGLSRADAYREGRRPFWD